MFLKRFDQFVVRIRLLQQIQRLQVHVVRRRWRWRQIACCRLFGAHFCRCVRLVSACEFGQQVSLVEGDGSFRFIRLCLDRVQFTCGHYFTLTIGIKSNRTKKRVLFLKSLLCFWRAWRFAWRVYGWLTRNSAVSIDVTLYLRFERSMSETFLDIETCVRVKHQTSL